MNHISWKIQMMFENLRVLKRTEQKVTSSLFGFFKVIGKMNQELSKWQSSLHFVQNPTSR